jgi:hypothetical protein
MNLRYFLNHKTSLHLKSSCGRQSGPPVRLEVQALAGFPSQLIRHMTQ